MEKVKKIVNVSLKDFLLMLIGSGLVAFASKCIYDPCNMVIGGVSGLAILIKWVGETFFKVAIPLWLTTVVFNVPLMLLAWKQKGFAFISKTLIATAMFSVWLAVIPDVTVVERDMVLATVFGGILTGAGIGLVFKAEATTGGTDAVAMLLWPYFKHISVAQILQVLDGIIVALGVFAFGISDTLYAIMAVYVAARITDGMLEGVKFAKQAFIITNEVDAVANEVMNKMERGITGLRAVGMYSQSEKTMLYCVVNKKEIVTLKEIVHKADANAFLVVTDAREVLGEGFLSADVQ